MAMSSQPLLHPKLDPAAIRLPWLSREFLLRSSLVALFVLLTYRFPWRWLRFVTSAAVLRICASLGMATARVSFDAIRIQGQLFRVVIACTFVDVFMGSIPLLWDVRKSLLRNALRLLAVAVIFFGLNLVRLAIAQVLYFRGVPWTLTDEVLGGFAYFAVWLFVWRQRTWRLLREV
jgi:exosortase/archaeosortase